MIMSEEEQCFSIVEALGLGIEVLMPALGCFPELYGDCPEVRLVSPEAHDSKVAAELWEMLQREELLSPESAVEAYAFFQENFPQQKAGENLLACYRQLKEFHK